MDGTLPLFPLDNVLFPDMLMPLHIFEPRYRLLVRRSIDGDRPFGVVLLRSGSDTGPGGIPHDVGTSATIVGHSSLPDGRSFIVVRGGRRFRIGSVDASTEPYLVGRVRWLRDDDGRGAEALADAAADQFSEYLNAILAATNEPHTEAPGLAELREGSPRDVAYRVASGLAIDASERQRLLEADAVDERLREEVRLLERENALLKELLLRIRTRGEGPTLN
ncbi:MAG TPA: LON peptidase substrate-binding domain-containing protein [Candidatus Limnocylindria bacterium]|nr:LON peptidase substrate-binding domain-containing protein [Candidatus Limnocylindria bacterium]